MGDAGVVDQDVEPTEPRLHRGDRAADARLPGHIDAQREAAPSERSHGRRRRPGRLEVGDRHVRALAGQGERDRPPDAARRPGDERDLAGQVSRS